MSSVRGRCLCGEIVYELNGELRHMTHCHCSMCRKAHGAAFATYVAVLARGFRWVSGQDEVTRYESSPGFLRSFCPRCGSVAPTPDDDGGISTDGDLVFVPAGNLEGDFGTRPEAHIFVASKAPWYTITDALPQFEEYPSDSALPSVAQAPRHSARRGHVAGSCLCGAVAFEYAGTPKVMMNCHCSRCRRAKSAAHASNVFVDPARFSWTEGEDRVVTYRLPDAKRFGHAFCRTCGSSVARAVPGAPVVNVPVGALDDDPGTRPRAHIYVASKAPWFEITDGLPRHAEMPAG